LIKIIAIHIQSEDVEIFIPGIIMREIHFGAMRTIDTPYPNEVIEMMIMDIPVKKLLIKSSGTGLIGTASPPKPIAVHFVIRPPENRHPGISEFFEIKRDGIHLSTPP